MMKKSIVLCADDYGQAWPISNAIIELMAEKRLSATSCIVTNPDWEVHALLLKKYQEKVSIGLHVNFTEGKPLSEIYRLKQGEEFISLGAMLKAAYLGRLDSKAVYAECEAQLLQFKNTLQFMPNFIDGHQHVHQFPIVREAILELYERYHLSTYATAIRISDAKINVTSLHKEFKKLLIKMTGALSLKKALQRKNIPFNATFAGIYDFDPTQNYRALFRQFLTESGERGLIMCHPGHPSLGDADPIGPARVNEFAYFMSNQFLEDLAACQVVIA